MESEKSAFRRVSWRGAILSETGWCGFGARNEFFRRFGIFQTFWCFYVCSLQDEKCRKYTTVFTWVAYFWPTLVVQGVKIAQKHVFTKNWRSKDFHGILKLKKHSLISMLGHLRYNCWFSVENVDLWWWYVWCILKQLRWFYHY